MLTTQLERDHAAQARQERKRNEQALLKAITEADYRVRTSRQAEDLIRQRLPFNKLGAQQRPGQPAKRALRERLDQALEQGLISIAARTAIRQADVIMMAGHPTPRQRNAIVMNCRRRPTVEDVEQTDLAAYALARSLAREFNPDVNAGINIVVPMLCGEKFNAAVRKAAQQTAVHLVEQQEERQPLKRLLYRSGPIQKLRKRDPLKDWHTMRQEEQPDLTEVSIKLDYAALRERLYHAEAEERISETDRSDVLKNCWLLEARESTDLTSPGPAKLYLAQAVLYPDWRHLHNIDRRCHTVQESTGRPVVGILAYHEMTTGLNPFTMGVTYSVEERQRERGSSHWERQRQREESTK